MKEVFSTLIERLVALGFTSLANQITKPNIKTPEYLQNFKFSEEYSYSPKDYDYIKVLTEAKEKLNSVDCSGIKPLVSHLEYMIACYKLTTERGKKWSELSEAEKEEIKREAKKK